MYISFSQCFKTKIFGWFNLCPNYNPNAICLFIISILQFSKNMRFFCYIWKKKPSIIFQFILIFFFCVKIMQARHKKIKQNKKKFSFYRILLDEMFFFLKRHGSSHHIIDFFFFLLFLFSLLHIYKVIINERKYWLALIYSYQIVTIVYSIQILYTIYIRTVVHISMIRNKMELINIPIQFSCFRIENFVLFI